MSFPPLRAWLLVILTSLFFLSFSYLLLGRWGLFLGLALALFWNYGMLLHRHKTSAKNFQGRPLAGRDPWHLLESLEHFVLEFNTPPCELLLSDNKQPLLLVSISDWKSPQILVSQGLLRILGPAERNALIALAVSTVKVRHTFRRYALDRMALTWMTLGQILDSILPFGHTHYASTLHYGIAWLHFKLAYPTSLQILADINAQKSLENPRDLASALWKLHGHIQTHPLKMPLFCLHQSLLGLPKSRRTAFQFMLPIELRLRSLVGYFPI